jgi:opacity protein-like surface antigen
MNKLLAGAVLFLGSVSAAQAQDVMGAGAAIPPAAMSDSSTISDVRFTAIREAGDLAAYNAISAPSAPVSTAVSTSTDFATPYAAPSAALPGDPAAVPDPDPDPRFLYGGRDDYRWQLGLGAGWERFRSKIFNASAVGFNTSISYYLNNWLGVEGNVLSVFAPTIFENEHVKIFNLTGGPRIAWRQRRWEPWLHGLVGFSHEQPQTSEGSRNAFAAQVGGGADYRINPRLSLRLQGDWLHTSFFSQSQNNFTLVGGAVVHF